MQREELGTGYYRFDLTGDRDEKEAVRVAEIFKKVFESQAKESIQGIGADLHFQSKVSEG